MGEYQYTSDRDGGMEGTIYADKLDDDCVNVFIGGINELLPIKVREDGKIKQLQQSYWCNELTGNFTDGGLTFTYKIKSVPEKTVTYTCTKTNSHTVRNRQYPEDQRDGWTGRYSYVRSGSDPSSGTFDLRKYSYNQIGIVSGHEGIISPLFVAAPDGTLTHVAGGNWEDFDGYINDSVMHYSYTYYETFASARVKCNAVIHATKHVSYNDDWK